MSIEINESVLKKEINQGIVPLGVPAAYKYDTALVENAKALANASLNQMKHGYGYPFTAATAVAMTDTTKIYVYTGSETGYTNGNWYYWNGTAWTSGGVYNATALETDKTLTVSGAAADAKVTGRIKEQADNFIEYNLAEEQGKIYYNPNNIEGVNFADKTGNIGVHLEGGFNSNNVPQKSQLYTNDKYDFGICDDEGNIIIGMVDGLLQTNTHLKGKKLSILGDSISTFSGYIPSGYAPFYPAGNVYAASQTWWYKLAYETGITILKNASWSGSKISGDTSNTTGVVGCSDARISALADGEDTPDIVVMYISINDWRANVELGDFNSDDAIPSGTVVNTIAEAYALAISKIETAYPSAKVFCCLNLTCAFEPDADKIYPFTNNRGDSLHDVNEMICKVASILGATVIDTEHAGITPFNGSLYTIDQEIHPNATGMNVIKNAVKSVLMNTVF